MTNLGTQMLSKDVTSFWSALLLLFVMLFLSLGYSFQSIAINTTRINKLTTTEDRIRQKTTEIARDPTAGNLEQLRQELTELTSITVAFLL
jgi:Tfp pilus assembly protein PilO